MWVAPARAVTGGVWVLSNEDSICGRCPVLRVQATVGIAGYSNTEVGGVLLKETKVAFELVHKGFPNREDCPTKTTCLGCCGLQADSRGVRDPVGDRDESST